MCTGPSAVGPSPGLMERRSQGGDCSSSSALGMGGVMESRAMSEESVISPSLLTSMRKMLLQYVRALIGFRVRWTGTEKLNALLFLC
jgi:hypothetical protein